MKYIFGNGDRVAIPTPVRANAPFGGEVRYTDPSFDWCYTQHGFIVGHDAEGRPLDLLLSDSFPSIPAHMHSSECLCEYFLIDFDGRVWRVYVQLSKKTPVIHHHYVYTNKKSWWVTTASNDTSYESEALLGFLTTHPSEEAVDAFWFANNKGETLSWFSISDIVERLNKEFPDGGVKKDDEDTATLTRLLERLVALREREKVKDDAP